MELFWKSSEVADPPLEGLPLPCQTNPILRQKNFLEIVNPMHGDPTWKNATGRY